MVMLKTTESRARGLEEDLIPNGVETGVEVRVETGQKRDKNELGLKVLALIRDNPSMTQRQAATLLGVTLKQAERSFERLKGLGVITRLGSKKAGYWQVSEKE